MVCVNPCGMKVLTYGVTCMLGMMRLTGEGGAADPGDAADWFERAAKQGNAAAQTELAELYLNGRGVRRNPEQAWIWARLATDYLTGDALKRAETIRDTAEKALSPDQLAKVKQHVDTWSPRSL